MRGDPSERRRFLDDLLVASAPRYAGVRADYDRVLKQRNALLKTAFLRPPRSGGGDMRTLDVWDSHLARSGADLLGARLALVEALRPRVATAYRAVAVGRRGRARRDRADLPLLARRGAADRRRRADARPRRARGGAARRAGAGAAAGGRARRLAGRPAPRRARARAVRRCRSRATPPTASRGRSRWRCGWRRTSCCGRRRRAGARARRRLRRARRGPARPAGRARRRAPSRCS